MFDRLQCYSRSAVLLIFFLTLSHCWRSFNVRYFDPIYTNLAPEIIETNCTIDEHGRITFYINMKRELTNAFVHILAVFDGDGIGKQNLVYGNKTINLCKFLTNRKESVLLNYIMKIGEKYGELPKRCPLKKKLYYVVNMKVVPDNLPPFVPIGNGTFTFTTMAKLPGDKELTIGTKASVSFKFDNKLKQSQTPKLN